MTFGYVILKLMFNDKCVEATLEKFHLIANDLKTQ